MTRPVQSKTTTRTGLDYAVLNSVTLSSTEPVLVGQESSSTKSVGIQKLAGMFVKRLLTQSGSNTIEYTEGTQFPSLLGNVGGDVDALYVACKNAVDTVSEQLIFEQGSTASLTTDEQLASANIENFNYDESASTLEFSVNIFNREGEGATLQLPSIVIT